MSKDTKPASRPVRFPAPDPSLQTRHLVVTRPVTPQVNEMLTDIYDILGKQLGMIKRRASLDELSSKDAATLHKYTLTLTLLRQEEEKRTKEMRLDDYTDDELRELTDRSQALLSNSVDNDTESDE